MFDHFRVEISLSFFSLGDYFVKKFEEFGLNLMKISKIRKWLPSKPLKTLIFAKKQTKKTEFLVSKSLKI